MAAKSRREHGTHDAGDAASPSQAPEEQSASPQDFFSNSELLKFVEQSEDPDYLTSLFAGSPLSETEILKVLGSKPELVQGAQDGMGGGDRERPRDAPVGWGRNLGEYRGVISYANGQGSSSYGLRGEYGLEFQCVEYVNRFAVQALGLGNMARTGHAKDYTTKRAGLTYVRNQADPLLPQPDDLLVFHGGGYGHVAIVTAVTDSRVDFIQQNSRSAFSSVDIKSRAGGSVLGTWGSYQVAGWQTPKEPSLITDHVAAASSASTGYTVQPGDSLSAIAGRMLGSVDRWPELAALNGIGQPYGLSVGQVLKLPGQDAESAEETSAPEQPNVDLKAAASDETGEETVEASTIDPAADATYQVKAGDSLWAIAAAQLGDGERWRELAQANGLRHPYMVEIGQSLRLPGVATPSADEATESAPERKVTVKPGDSLWAIAQRELGDGGRWPELEQLNGLRDGTIHPGDELKIPASVA